jgi:hypothetical protein
MTAVPENRMPGSFRLPATAALAFIALAVPAGPAQEKPLLLQVGMPGGLRASVTESWGTLRFTLTNANSAPRQARIFVLYPGHDDTQFGRDVWIPAHSSLSGWVPIGPAPGEGPSLGREIQVLLYDRTDGQDVLILPPGELKVRGRPVAYRKREPTTAVVADVAAAEGAPIERPQSATRALEFVHALRHTGGLSENVSVVPAGFLPPTPAAFDGIDHVVLASERLADDPPAQRALRHWVEQGGKLWVMLDLVRPQAVAPVLGDELDIQTIDRVSLTTVRVYRRDTDPRTAPAREFDEPVDLVRVIPGPADQVLHLIDGWPASFTRQVGRGKVLFTTLGSRGWHRPRNERDPASRFEHVPDVPVEFLPLTELAAELRPRSAAPALGAEDLRPLLTEEIGYSVIGWQTVGAVLGAFVLALFGLGTMLRRSRRPELVGWLAAGAALVVAGLFLALGENSRRAVPPTVAFAAVVDAVPGSGEAAVTGLFAVYRPSSGPAPVSTRSGAMLDVNMDGLDGQVRRHIQTDLDAWRWDDLRLPAGVRTGPFHFSAKTGRMAAVVRFGPEGVVGRLHSGPFRDPADALIVTTAREPIAVRVNGDGTVSAGASDVLTAGQYLPGTVLSDRQQRRQEVYRRLLSGLLPEHLEGRDLLLAWADPADPPFAVEDGERAAGTALLIVPVEYEHSPAGTRVTVPRAFIPYRRFLDGRLQQPTTESIYPADMHLRFQLPASVLPLTVERATLAARVRAPGWRLAVSGISDNGPVPLHASASPLDPVRVEITDAQLLKVDDQGGLHLNVSLAGEQTETRWRIESLTLEVVGRR